MTRLLPALLLAVALPATAIAQTTPRVPPAGSVALSAILAKVEQRPGFQYVDEIEWEDGAYSIVYFTDDKAKVEIHFDPVTGEPK